jgi:hypothetical protein
VTQTVSLAPPYALVEELAQVLDLPAEDTATHVDLQRALDAGKAWIDWFTGRTFGLSPAATVRVTAAATLDAVPVADLHSTSPGVEVDTAGDRTFATTLTADQYSLEPYGGPPFDTLRAWPLPPTGTEPYVFVPGELVRITGVWGYVDERGRCPAPVAEANLLLGARWFKRREAPFGVLQQAELDAFQVLPRQDADVLTLLFPLSRPGSPGALLAASQAMAGGVAVGGEWVMV